MCLQQDIACWKRGRLSRCFDNRKSISQLLPDAKKLYLYEHFLCWLRMLILIFCTRKERDQNVFRPFDIDLKSR